MTPTERVVAQLEAIKNMTTSVQQKASQSNYVGCISQLQEIGLALLATTIMVQKIMTGEFK